MIGRVAESLVRGQTPRPEWLAALGDPLPRPAVAALARAARVPELASGLARWLPALLLSGAPGRGAAALQLWVERIRKQRGAVPELASGPLLAPLLGASERVAGIVLERPEWALDLAGDPPALPDTDLPECRWEAIAEARARGLLRIAGRDWLGCPLTESLRAWSDLADRIATAGLEWVVRECGGEVPELWASGVWALGELTPCAPLPLVLRSGREAADAGEHAERLRRELTRPRRLGPIWPVASPAGSVYHRPLAGARSRPGTPAPAPAGAGPAADPADLRAALEAVEVRVSTLCAAVDSRPPCGILEAVSGLEERGWIADQTADALSDGYAWLRRAEHVLQLADGTPDVRMPRTRDAQTALARRMGYRDPEGERARRRMLADADRARERVGEAMARLSADAGAASPRTRRYHPAGLAGGER